MNADSIGKAPMPTRPIDEREYDRGDARSEDLREPGSEVVAAPSGPSPVLGFDGPEMLARWTEIQTGFVDEPLEAVRQADEFVSEVIERLIRGYSEKRRHLGEEIFRDGDVDTEVLRVALQRDREFFQRLMAA